MVTRCDGGPNSGVSFDPCINFSDDRYNSYVLYLIFHRYLIFFFPVCCFLDIDYYILHWLVDNVTDGH